MQSGIDSSRLRIAAFEAKGETRIDIRPDAAVETAQTQEAQAKSTDFFGKDGPSFRDVLDAINPLNHLPIVSDIVAAKTGHQVSAASRMVGGALLGGPIGFVASLVSVIFEDATGQSPAEAAYAALTGVTEPATALARNDTASETQIANAAPQDAEEIDHNLEQAEAAPVDEVNVMQLASLSPSAPSTQDAIVQAVYAAPTPASKAVLDLYGSSPTSVHNSYKKAQMRSYLHDVTVSKIL